MKNIEIIKFSDYRKSVPEILEKTNIINFIKENSEKKNVIMIKPNLVNKSKFPVTTPPECCEEIIKFLRENSVSDIIIAEGCGEPGYETGEVFDILGYGKIAKKYNVSLVDLNYEPVTKIKNQKCKRFPEMYLPSILFSSFIISVPVLKAHSLSIISGTMKNMVGAAPPEYYSEYGGFWRKSSFHIDIHNAVKDLNSYRTPDFTLMDATLGLSEYHLGGKTCNPPVNKLIAGADPVEIDRKAAELLGIDFRKIPHLN